MASPRNKHVASIQKAIDDFPEALDVLGGYAEQFLHLKRKYVDAHWGNGGRSGMSVQSIPDPSEGLIEMGRLVEIAYETAKGKGRRVERFVHEFNRPYPILTFTAADCGLVVVRDRSVYTVTDRGIEG